MRSYNTAQQTIEEIASDLASGARADLTEKETQVKAIIDSVRRRGDAAVCEYTKRFDGAALTPAKLKVKPAELKAARKQIGKGFEAALTQAAENICRFHEKQLPSDWFDSARAGMVLGEKFTPLESVGIHVPGATATYPSSVLMTVIPAQVAGVKEIHLATPPGKDGKIPFATLAAADFLGVHSVFKMAGAHAVAAFAYGTKTVPKVDKIIGPGNIYVMLAKKLVFGAVGIDGLYGPSEVVIVADKKANASWVAADLLAQSEHGGDSCAILISPSRAVIEEVKSEVLSQARRLPRQKVALEAWTKHGALVQVKNLAEGFALANLIAPEHLELNVEDARGHLDKVKNAGCVLLGAYSPAAVSDYVAGPSHSLPTGRSAVFSSGLGVMDFMKRSDVVSISLSCLEECAETIRQFTALEGLEGHYRAVELRLRGIAAKKTK